MKKKKFQFVAAVVLCVVALLGFVAGTYYQRNQGAKALSLTFQKMSTGTTLQTGEECFYPKVPSVNGCVNPEDLNLGILNNCIKEGGGQYDIRYCRCLAATNNNYNQCNTYGG